MVTYGEVRKDVEDFNHRLWFGFSILVNIDWMDE